LPHENLLQLVSHHGIDSEGDLGWLCRSKILRPAGNIVVNGTCNVFLCPSFQSLLHQFSLGFARPGNNIFTDRTGPRHGVYRPLVTPLLFTQ